MTASDIHSLTIRFALEAVANDHRRCRRIRDLDTDLAVVRDPIFVGSDSGLVGGQTVPPTANCVAREDDAGAGQSSHRELRRATASAERWRLEGIAGDTDNTFSPNASDAAAAKRVVGKVGLGLGCATNSNP